jgi:hypothetical protein
VFPEDVRAHLARILEGRRLRSKLKVYYEGEGSQNPVLIALRPGSYVPLIRLLKVAPEAVSMKRAATAALEWLNMDRFYEPLKKAPRFPGLVRRLNLI